MDADDIRAQFNAVAAGYGGWHRQYAERLIALTPLSPGQHVLDVGTGTGLAAIAAARSVGPSGKVVGIDIAERMIGQAKLAASEAELRNVEFRVADGASVPFPSETFDAVVCSSAIIYLPLPDAVREWWRVLKPGGVAAFSTLRNDSPRAGVVFREVAASYGVPLSNPNEIGSLARCRALMGGHGFDHVDVQTETLRGDPTTPESAWVGNIGSAVFSAVRRLAPDALEAMRTAYMASLKPSDLDEPYIVLFVIGRRSG